LRREGVSRKLAGGSTSSFVAPFGFPNIFARISSSEMVGSLRLVSISSQNAPFDSAVKSEDFSR